jgi:hypothetical protein
MIKKKIKINIKVKIKVTKTSTPKTQLDGIISLRIGTGTTFQRFLVKASIPGRFTICSASVDNVDVLQMKDFLRQQEKFLNLKLKSIN